MGGGGGEGEVEGGVDWEGAAEHLVAAGGGDGVD